MASEPEATVLTAEQEEELKTAFDSFDEVHSRKPRRKLPYLTLYNCLQDGDGSISKEELTKMLRSTDQVYDAPCFHASPCSHSPTRILRASACWRR